MTLAEAVPVEDVLITSVAVIVGGILITVLLSAFSASAKRRQDFLETVARRVKGTSLPRSFSTLPRIDFLLAGWKASVEFFAGGDDTSPYTRVFVQLQGRSPGTFHLIPEGFAQSFLKMFGAQDLSCGDLSFDDEYVIKATPESLAARVFRPEQRARVIASVRRLQGMSRPTLSVTRDELSVKVAQNLSEVEAVMLLVRTAEEFLGYLIPPAPTPGVALGEVLVAPAGTCPVCGTKMDDLVVRCDSCRTPHHEECWRYVGRCSTYACKGTRAVA